MLVALHFLNCVLLWCLLQVLARKRRESFLAAGLFAISAAYLVSLNEALLGFFVLLTLISWFRKGRYLIAVVFYCLALYSNRWAPVVVVLILLIHWWRHERIFTVQLALLFVPTLVFLAIPVEFNAAALLYVMSMVAASLLAWAIRRYTESW